MHFTEYELNGEKAQDFLGLVKLIQELWYYPDYAQFDKKKLRLELHTGGWSGNEELIEELKQTFFWFVCHCEWHRGGHYYFQLPKFYGERL